MIHPRIVAKIIAHRLAALDTGETFRMDFTFKSDKQWQKGVTGSFSISTERTVNYHLVIVTAVRAPGSNEFVTDRNTVQSPAVEQYIFNRLLPYKTRLLDLDITWQIPIK